MKSLILCIMATIITGPSWSNDNSPENSDELCQKSWWQEATIDKIQKYVEKVGEAEFLNARCDQEENSYLHLATSFSKNSLIIAELVDMGFYPEEENLRNQSSIDIDELFNNNSFKSIFEGNFLQKNTSRENPSPMIKGVSLPNLHPFKAKRDGWYFGLGAGISLPTTTSTKEGRNRDTVCYPENVCFIDDSIIPGPGYTWQYDLDAHASAIAELFLGHFLGPFRVELSFAQSKSDLSQNFKKITDLNGKPVTPERDDNIIQTNTQIGIDRMEMEDINLNFYYDFLNKTPVTPYLGVGIGFSRVEIYGASYENKRKDVGPNPESRSYDPPLSFYDNKGDYNLVDRASFWKLYSGVDFALNDKALLGVKLTYSGQQSPIEYTGRYNTHPMNQIDSNFNYSEKFLDFNRFTWMITLKMKMK